MSKANINLKFLITLCFEEMSNAQIAERLSIDKADVYALRSRYNITRDKIKNYKSRGITAREYYNTLGSDLLDQSEKPNLKCGICGTRINEENLWEFPDGTQVHLCEHCEKAVEFYANH